MKKLGSWHLVSWQIKVEKVEAVTDFLFMGSKITVDGDCSYEIKKLLLFGRKAMTNIDNIIKKQRRRNWLGDTPLIDHLSFVFCF